MLRNPYFTVNAPQLFGLSEYPWNDYRRLRWSKPWKRKKRMFYEFFGI